MPDRGGLAGEVLLNSFEEMLKAFEHTLVLTQLLLDEKFDFNQIDRAKHCVSHIRGLVTKNQEKLEDYRLQRIFERLTENDQP